MTRVSSPWLWGNGDESRSSIGEGSEERYVSSLFGSGLLGKLKYGGVLEVFLSSLATGGKLLVAFVWLESRKHTYSLLKHFQIISECSMCLFPGELAAVDPTNIAYLHAMVCHFLTTSSCWVSLTTLIDGGTNRFRPSRNPFLGRRVTVARS